jgi:hypothetical protein
LDKASRRLLGEVRMPQPTRRDFPALADHKYED